MGLFPTSKRSISITNTTSCLPQKVHIISQLEIKGIVHVKNDKLIFWTSMIVVKMQQQLQMPRSALFEVTLFKKLHSELGGPTRAAWRASRTTREAVQSHTQTPGWFILNTSARANVLQSTGHTCRTPSLISRHVRFIPSIH